MIPARKNSGFTLIELLVVISIIGLLSSIILASLSGAKIKAVDAKVAADFRQLKVALELYRLDNGDYPYACKDANDNTGYCNQTFSFGTPVSGDTMNYNGNLRPVLVPKYISSLPTPPAGTGWYYHYRPIPPIGTARLSGGLLGNTCGGKDSPVFDYMLEISKESSQNRTPPLPINGVLVYFSIPPTYYEGSFHPNGYCIGN